MARKQTVRVGVDTGGTFTDLACLVPGIGWRRWKVLSTPDDPSRAIMEGLEALLPDNGFEGLELVHGTTVGTNAFLERKGARTVLVTTKNFEDILWIGRQARPELYDFMVTRSREIIPRRQVIGVSERMNWKGEVLTSLGPEEAERVRRFAKARGAKSIAVCLLHSYANPAHERAIAKALSSLGIHISLSSNVLPEFREFERMSTTLINSYLGPVVGEYVDRLGRMLTGAKIFIQQSNGGCRPASDIGNQAVHTLLSGPAGGVQAAWRLGQSFGMENIITLDMGGTSTDVSICAGDLTYTRDYEIEGYPVAVPMLDIHTVGAGGGSIAWVDAGGFLRVGPRSAGSSPGPVCYGRGEEIAVTDANLFLGRLRPEAFLAGRMKLHPKRVGKRLQELGRKLTLSARETALGIIRLVNTNMVQAIRKVSIERGYDPRNFALVCFGGAAGLHAAELADAISIPKVLLPRMAGVFSAQGMAEADLLFDTSMAFIMRKAQDNHRAISQGLDGLAGKMMEELRRAGLDTSEVILQKQLDVRYYGQSFEITIPWSSDWPEAFGNEHRRLYGYDMPGRDLEVTALRLRAVIPRPCADSDSRGGCGIGKLNLSGSSTPDKVLVDFEDGAKETLLLDRVMLDSGEFIKGPALIIDDFTTILVPDGWKIEDVSGHLLMEKVVS